MGIVQFGKRMLYFSVSVRQGKLFLSLRKNDFKLNLALCGRKGSKILALL